MRRLLRLAPLLGLLGFVAVSPSPAGVTPARAATVVNAHVHDDYFHPTGSFVVGPGHSIAQALCMGAAPDPTCTVTINENDSVAWVAPAPFAVNPHSVTECSDGTWTTCGPGVSLHNPIEDSGVRMQPGWPYVVQFNVPGTYYYRCEVHPTTMRGVVQVNDIASVGGPVEVFTGGDSGGSGLPYIAVAGAGALALAAGAFAVGRRLTRARGAG